MTEIFSKLDDREYLYSVLEDIKTSNDLIMLNNILKILSIKLHDNAIDYETAKMINDAVNSRRKSLTTGSQAYYSPSQELNNREEDKVMVLKPAKNRRNTAVSDRKGYAAMVFIVTNVAVTTVMYTMLLIGKFIK